MKILYVSSEANPFAASGGLGDVMGALPSAISNQGHDVSVILPLYDNIDSKYKEEFIHVTDLSFELSWRSTGASVYKYKIGNVSYYFIKNNYYFDRANLYGEYDDGERFAFFSMSVIEFMLKENNIPDILQANDWQTALTVIYLKTIYSKEELCQQNIRKITPKEAFMLQGFNEDFYEKVETSGNSNTQLYKQAGNAISVNTVYAIMYYLFYHLKLR